MSLLATLRWRLFGIRNEVIDRTQAAVRMAQETTTETRRLNRVLREYAEKANPIVSMMGDIYNQREIENVWRGPPGQ